MKKFLLAFFTIMPYLAFGQAETDCSKIEPSYLNRIPGFKIANCEYSEFNEVEFLYDDLKGKSTSTVKSGEFRKISYEKDESYNRSVSGAQIRNNYLNAVLKINGKSLSVYNNFFSFSNNGNEVFLHINYADDNDDKGFVIRIVEVKSMTQDIEISLQEAIERDGKAAIYGILFDVGKSTIKSESAEALKTITEYLNAYPEIKIIVVGHTDNTGNYDSNIALSKDRAESVRNYLINNSKIAESRIRSAGIGSLCPVSTNNNEDGRKKNRRVEIVKQ